MAEDMEVGVVLKNKQVILVFIPHLLSHCQVLFQVIWLLSLETEPGNVKHIYMFMDPFLLPLTRMNVAIFKGVSDEESWRKLEQSE